MSKLSLTYFKYTMADELFEKFDEETTKKLQNVCIYTQLLAQLVGQGEKCERCTEVGRDVCLH